MHTWVEYAWWKGAGGVEEMRGILSLHTLAMHLLVVSPLTCFGNNKKDTATCHTTIHHVGRDEKS